MSGCYIILNKSKSTEDKLLVKVGCSKDCESRFKQIERSNRFVGSKDELELMQINSLCSIQKDGKTST